MCKNCKKEYKENENYKWKCRTHRSEYSKEDDLWWCCLKKGIDNKGCKLQKHECLEDEEDEDIEEKEKNREKEMKLKRCQCCREIGHLIENCPRDPNLKTIKDMNEIDKENKRVLMLKDDHKIRFSESKIVTAHLLKNCTKVPVIDDVYDKYHNLIRQQETKIKRE